MERILFDNIIYNTRKQDNFIDFIDEQINSRKGNKLIIVHINLRNYYYLNKNIKLKEFIKNNCYVIFEGIGMKISFWIKGYGFLSDLNGTDLFPLFLKKISNTDFGLYLLGSNITNIKLATENLGRLFPTVKISGYSDGYFQKADEPFIVDIINKSCADILIIGRGFPLQEEFILRNKEFLKLKIVWNVGGLFDTLSGNKQRCPAFFRKLRLEWLYRMIKEPRRMFHRNTVAACWSIWNILFKKQN